MPALFQIALGGALGAMLRFAVVTLSVHLFGAGLPWGTFLVNMLGSFAIGVAFVAVAQETAAWRQAAPFLMPGLLGGFTTFSAFSIETLMLLERGRLVAAAGYAAGSVLLGLLAAAVGVWAARNWSPA